MKNIMKDVLSKSKYLVIFAALLIGSCIIMLESISNQKESDDLAASLEQEKALNQALLEINDELELYVLEKEKLLFELSNNTFHYELFNAVIIDITDYGDGNNLVIVEDVQGDLSYKYDMDINNLSVGDVVYVIYNIRTQNFYFMKRIGE